MDQQNKLQIEKDFYSLIYGDIEKDDKKNDFSEIDNFINNNNNDALNVANYGFCGLSFNTLCEQYAINALGLRGVSVFVYRFLASHYINNDLYKNKQYVCCSLAYLAYSVSCSFASVKRVVKKLCDMNIIKKVSSGLHGRNVYVINKIFDFSASGLILKDQNEPLNKKSSKKIKLKKEKEYINDYSSLKSSNCLPSWLHLYASTSQIVQNDLVLNKDDLNEHIRIANYNCWLDD